MGFFDSVTDTVSSAFSSIGDLWGGHKQPEAPISVPVSAKQQADAEKMVRDSDEFAKSGRLNPYEQQKKDREEQAKANDPGAFPNKEARHDYEKAQAGYQKALDSFIAGKGPNPGPMDDYMRTAPRTDYQPMYRPNYGGGSGGRNFY